MSKTINPLIQRNNINVNQYMNVSELSKLLKMSTSHIYSLTSTKKIPHIKLLGKKILFEKSEINNWLKSKSVSAN
jgi:excisionase family DNA binding protein